MFILLQSSIFHEQSTFSSKITNIPVDSDEFLCMWNAFGPFLEINMSFNKTIQMPSNDKYETETNFYKCKTEDKMFDTPVF